MSATPRILSIAGTDPSGGAGIQADLKSIGANGGYGMSVVTALVAQNTMGVRSVHVPPVSFLAEQLDAVSDDVEIDAVKIGMLANREVIETVERWLDRVRPSAVVLDPVMVATSGDRLLDSAAERALRDLIAKADLITPNIPELAVLAEMSPAATWDDVLVQAERVARRHRVRVLAKGGHLDGKLVPDALVDGRDTAEFAGHRIETANTHGTGCSLSSAVATIYARTGSWERSVRDAKLWLRESIRHGAELAVGEGNGPVNHFAGLWQRGGLDTRPTAEEVAEEWWTGLREIRDAIERSSFVSGLRNGTLPQAAFEWYLAQDMLYLQDYSRVLAEASRLAPGIAEQAFWARGAHRALSAELHMHAERLSTVEPLEESRTTRAYLDHLFATKTRGDYGILSAAVLPCYWIYADLGERLQDFATEAHPYRDWIRTFGDPEFLEASDAATEIVTRHAAALPTQRREAMWRAFRASAEYELAFFEAPLHRNR